MQDCEIHQNLRAEIRPVDTVVREKICSAALLRTSRIHRNNIIDNTSELSVTMQDCQTHQNLRADIRPADTAVKEKTYSAAPFRTLQNLLRPVT